MANKKHRNNSTTCNNAAAPNLQTCRVGAAPNLQTCRLGIARVTIRLNNWLVTHCNDANEWRQWSFTAKLYFKRRLGLDLPGFLDKAEGAKSEIAPESRDKLGISAAQDDELMDQVAMITTGMPNQMVRLAIKRGQPAVEVWRQLADGDDPHTVNCDLAEMIALLQLAEV